MESTHVIVSPLGEKKVKCSGIVAHHFERFRDFWYGLRNSGGLGVWALKVSPASSQRATIWGLGGASVCLMWDAAFQVLGLGLGDLACRLFNRSCSAMNI